jgi:hypothetical protein
MLFGTFSLCEHLLLTPPLCRLIGSQAAGTSGTKKAD